MLIPVAFQRDQEDVGRLLGEEHLPLPGDPHQRRVLGGERPLHKLAEAAGALMVEGDLSLEGHHGALGGQHVGAKGHLEHLAALLDEAFLGLDLVVGLCKQVTTHAGILAYGQESLGGNTSSRATWPEVVRWVDTSVTLL
jgi:hypothetical protein